ncbi:hypothetical protein TNCV_2869751 [Trichonephila clavipes]|nr:hypothetical protein TNCV_2869751 [Trichonephila clavipes]
MPPVWLTQIKAHKIHHGKGLLVRLSLAVALSTIQAWLYPNFKGEQPGIGQGLPPNLPLPTASRKDLLLNGYLEHPHAAKSLYIYKHPCLLRDSNQGLMTQQSAPLIAI